MMVKSVFVGASLPYYYYKELGESGANELIVWADFLNKPKWIKDKNRWLQFREFDIPLSVSFSAFEQGDCPASNESRKKFFYKLHRALKLKPKVIWLDHFRFDGYWEGVENGHIPETHTECQYCIGKNRALVVKSIADSAKRKVGRQSSLGYFAVPFRIEEIPDLILELGQDHRILGSIFQKVSPMLYHRMLGKPVSYISEYTSYLGKLTNAEIVPIIQIKDMPDDISDSLGKEEFEKSLEEAVKNPSNGVSIFMWEHIVRSEKLNWVKESFVRKL